MGFTELTAGGRRYCLEMVDMFSKWVEVFTIEVIPRWGIPEKLSSDNSKHFIDVTMQQLSERLNVALRTHGSHLWEVWFQPLCQNYSSYLLG